jgi:hypothetical protein
MHGGRSFISLAKNLTTLGASEQRCFLLPFKVCGVYGRHVVDLFGPAAAGINPLD